MCCTPVLSRPIVQLLASSNHLLCLCLTHQWLQKAVRIFQGYPDLQSEFDFYYKIMEKECNNIDTATIPP